MLLNGNRPGNLPEKEQAQQYPDCFEAGVLSFLSGNISEALLLFSCCDKYDAAVMFSLACCLLRAGELGADGSMIYAEAEGLLHSAQDKLAQRAIRPGYQQTVLGGNTYRTLEQSERENNRYKMPVPRQLAQFFPDLLRERIQRMLVDIYAATGQRNKLQTAVNALSGKGYANVKAAKELLEKTESEE